MDEKGALFDKRAEFGKWLKAQKALNGLSQVDIAKSIGYNNWNFISLVERGISAIPMEKIKAFADAYKVDFGEFALKLYREVYPEQFEIIKAICKHINKGKN